MADWRPPHAEPEIQSDEKCYKCGLTGHVVVSRFRWAGESHLHWRCVNCRHVWITPDRREEPRK